MVEKRLAHHNVVAAVETLDEGRGAIAELRDAGVDDDELSLLGPDHAMRPGQGRVTESPGSTATGGVGRSALGGLGAGTVGGGVIGSIAGLAVSAIPGVGLAAGAAALYAGIAGAATGQIAGGLIGAETGGRKAMMWGQSLQPFLARVRQDDMILVGVHTEDAARADTAEERLRDLDPVEVVRLEADESFIPPGDMSAVAGRSVPSGDAGAPGADLGRDRADDEDPTVGMVTRGPDREDTDEE